MKINVELSQVESSSVDRLAYYASDSEVANFIDYPYNIKGDLLVDFKSGQSYIYKNVPFITLTMVMTSNSIGSALHSGIVSGGYEFEKIV